jgi:hypothetical protein
LGSTSAPSTPATKHKSLNDSFNQLNLSSASSTSIAEMAASAQKEMENLQPNTTRGKSPFIRNASAESMCSQVTQLQERISNSSDTVIVERN